MADSSVLFSSGPDFCSPAKSALFICIYILCSARIAGGGVGPLTSEYDPPTSPEKNGPGGRLQPPT
jgi:hypothetical protein